MEILKGIQEKGAVIRFLFWKINTENANDGLQRRDWKHEELVGPYPVSPFET